MISKIVKSQTNQIVGAVVAIAREQKESYGGWYSVWVGTDCVAFGLCLDAANEIMQGLLKCTKP